MTNLESADVLLDVVNRLSILVQQLSAMAEQLDLVNIDASDDESLEADCLTEAMQIRKERLRLIEAWTELEAEQRALALQTPTTSRQKNTTTHASVMPTIIANSPISTDSRAQFAFLQYECDRRREHDST